ncbi:MAG: maltose alpha-D-glucosyltransferase [Candidatus Magnetoovum sp. WYHC-5]|nr:maltose alpha-D-glucosyltransferase [Candidatus Magnetoovum sp. WYHC-5]
MKTQHWDDSLWYKDAIIYELHVKAFFDSNEDGMGDFKGLIQKLDYLYELGITAIWLLPFYPSPLKDDGYDIADYYDVHKDYGNLKDFKYFLNEAHERGINVITEMVLNHTSDQHVWFKRSKEAKKTSRWRNYYVWSNTNDKYKEARVIFKDFEKSNWTFDDNAKLYYWHRFYSHQPDLNYDNPHVQKESLKVLDYWFKMGVDGMRLDAIPYLYEREGSNCENLPETFEFLKKIRIHVETHHKGKMLLSEANQWPEDAIKYFGYGDASHMCFHFPLMPRMFMSVWLEDKFPIMDILEQTPAIHDSCQWALFLRNHDELTLEMVSDEERDYMYKVYAQDPMARINFGIRRRLAPLMRNNRKLIELMNVMLFTLPGTPIIYYGDEIGMGDNYYLGDRNSVRTPMQWNANRNAGFSNCNPQKLYLPLIIDPVYHYENINVENQRYDQDSLIWWMRKFIRMRKGFKAFGRGSIEFIQSENRKLLSYIRKIDDEIILIIVNLSRFPQVGELNLSTYAGYLPIEIEGKTVFPIIKDNLYTITAGPHGYYLFSLKKSQASVARDEQTDINEIRVFGSWEGIFEENILDRFQNTILPKFLYKNRWFKGKGKVIQDIKLIENFRLAKKSEAIHIAFFELTYTEGLPEILQLPIAFVNDELSGNIKEQFPHSIICHLSIVVDKGNLANPNTVHRVLNGVLYDGVYNKNFQLYMLSFTLKGYETKGLTGKLIGYQGKFIKELKKQLRLGMDLEPRVLHVDQSNSSIVYGEQLFFKYYRFIEQGVNPEEEMMMYLSEQKIYKHSPLFYGSIRYAKEKQESVTLGTLQEFMQGYTNCWTYTVDEIKRYFERVRASEISTENLASHSCSLIDFECDLSDIAKELIGYAYIELASLLGVRIAELHLNLADENGNTDFKTEPFTSLYQRALYQSIYTSAKQVLRQLERMKNIPDEFQKDIKDLLSCSNTLFTHLKILMVKQIDSKKIRTHGDLHIGQILYSGKDFFIIDFEGEPMKTINEKRTKRSPLRDVAGIIRSFHYAIFSQYIAHCKNYDYALPQLRQWTKSWYYCISRTFLGSYINRLAQSNLIPTDKTDINDFLTVLLIEKALYEINYEINNRPLWVNIPINGLLEILKSGN